MKQHTTNYFNTFIEVAADTQVLCGTIPPARNQKSIAEIQFQIISEHPYEFTSDDVLFQVYALRNDLLKADYPEAKAAFFSKAQACFRASPLTKNYGFGIHSDSHGKVALVGMETMAYQTFLADDKIKKLKAMRSSRK